MSIDWLSEKIQSREFSGVSIDSRQVKEKEIFFALAGKKVNGHLFLAEASQKKAAAAVVSKNYSGHHFGLKLIYVDDVLETLHALARNVFSFRSTKILGVTGSVGKTTTKEFIATLLENKFRLNKTPGTYNSQATFPLCLLNSPGNEELFVMEMGMSLPGELSRLVAIAPPDIAFVGRLALAHAASFPDGLEGIARAKAEILLHSKTKIVILHEETSKFAPFRSLEGKRAFQYDYSGFCLKREKEKWCIYEKGISSPHFDLPFEASHLREDFLGAAAVARALNLEWEEILSQVGKLQSIPSRFEKIEKSGVVFINDSYNANPTSMKAALENLPNPKGGKRIGVLGEMRELGPFSKDSHREIGELALKYLDELLCLGEECIPLVEAFKEGGKNALLFMEISSLKTKLFRIIQSGDVVLIKGSNSKQMWTLLE